MDWTTRSRTRSARQCHVRFEVVEPIVAVDDTAETEVDAHGTVAGYGLFWFDSVTAVGMLEPMRVEDAYQRRGLARALLTFGLERLAARGARSVKVGFDGEPGRNLYLGAGFVETATVRAFTRTPDRAS